MLTTPEFTTEKFDEAGNDFACGMELDDVGTWVRVQLRIDGTLAAGTYPASATAGLVAVDSDSYDPAACPLVE